MDTDSLGTLGLITMTFAMPVLLVAVDDRRTRLLRRRPVVLRAYASQRTRSQAHPMVNVHRS